MYKIILTALLIIVSGCDKPSMQWKKYAVSDGVPIDFYFDPTSIRRDGDIVKFWHLMDYKSPSQIEGHLSTTFETEFDCKQKQTRVIYSASFSGNMGSGKVFRLSDHDIPFGKKYYVIRHGIPDMEPGKATNLGAFGFTKNGNDDNYAIWIDSLGANQWMDVDSENYGQQYLWKTACG